MAIQEKFPSIRPSLNLDFANTKTLDPRVTFSRASTATYYDGKTVAKAEENLLLWSQDLRNALWTSRTLLTSVSNNLFTAPDGTQTANQLIATAGSGSHGISVGGLVTGTQYMASVFLKADTHNFVGIGSNHTGTVGVVNLSNGSVVTGTITVTSAGNGWYRVSGLFIPGGGAGLYITFTDASGNTTLNANGTESVLVWGAQAEHRTVLTAYTPTTTQPITNYVPVLRTAAANVARFDHNPVTGESLGLLIEEQRTNLVLRSQEFDNANWAKSGVTVTANAVVAPDGTLSADKVVSTTSTSEQTVAQSPSYTAGVSYAITVYAKAGELNLVQLRFNNGAFANGEYATFNLSTGVITQSSGSGHSISSVGNGWYRCCVVGTATATAAPIHGYVFQLTANPTGGRNPKYTGDGYSGIYIWGAQLEAGAFPTSYIKTEASQVTRAADAASMTGANFSSWFNPAEGTVYSEFALKPGQGVYPSPWSIADSTAFGANCTTRIQPYQNGTKTSLGFDVTVANVSQVNIVATVSNLSSFTKHAGAYKFNDFAASSEGFVAGTDTSGVLATNYAQLAIGRDVTGNVGKIGSHIRKITYYPQRLSNTQLQALTS